MNLIDLINGQLTSGVVSNISSALGESTDRTRAGITAAIPSILSEFDNVASTADGARRLRMAVDDADDGILGNMGRFLGNATSASSGLGTLSSILDSGGLSSLTGSLGRSTGLSRQSTSTLLGLLAPMVLGVMKRILTSGTSGFSDVESLLASQRFNIAAAMPSGVQTEGYEHETYAPREAVHRVAETERVPRRERSSLSWIVPLALLAVGLALVWQLARPTTGVQAGRERTETRQAQKAVDEPRTSFSLDALKAKYSSVLQLARAEGVHFSQIQQDNGKLVLKGTAPSQEAANKVWNEIKRINPKMNDITADISVSSTTPSSTVFQTRPQSLGEEAGDLVKQGMETPRKLGKSTNTETYIVQRGDTLTSISKHFYGSGKDYTKILKANLEQISDDDFIEVGQKLTIPMQ